MSKKMPTVKYISVDDERSAQRVAAAFEVLFRYVLEEWRNPQGDKRIVKVDSLESRARIKMCDVDKTRV